MDLDLNFLDAFVQQETLEGKPQYDKSKSLTLSNVGSNIPSSSLKYTAYVAETRQFTPFVATPNQEQPKDPQPQQIGGPPPQGQAHQEIKLAAGTKSVWGQAGGQPNQPAQQTSEP